MAYEPKDNTGTIFFIEKDDRKSDTHPAWNGSIMVNGVEYWADAWTNKSDAGKIRINLKFKPKGERRTLPPDGKMKPRQAQDDDSEIPF